VRELVEAAQIIARGFGDCSSLKVPAYINEYPAYPFALLIDTST
jgi:hypothetical protein